MEIEAKIKELKILLPAAKDPVGSYVAAKIVNKLLFISGQISMDQNGKLIKGKVGKDLNLDEGYNAAVRCALSITAQKKKACNKIGKAGRKACNTLDCCVWAKSKSGKYCVQGDKEGPELDQDAKGNKFEYYYYLNKKYKIDD